MTRKRQEQSGEIRRPPRGAPDPLQMFLCPRVWRDGLGSEVGATEDRHEEVVEVVGDSSGQDTEALELLRLPQLSLQPDLLLLGAHALGHIGRYAEDAFDRSPSTGNG